MYLLTTCSSQQSLFIPFPPFLFVNKIWKSTSDTVSEGLYALIHSSDWSPAAANISSASPAICPVVGKRAWKTSDVHKMFFHTSLSTIRQISGESLSDHVALQCRCVHKAPNRLCVSIASPVCGRMFQTRNQDNVCSVTSSDCLDHWFGNMPHTETVWMRWACVWECLSWNAYSGHPKCFYNKLEQVMRGGIVWHRVHKTTQDFSQHVSLFISCLASW